MRLHIKRRLGLGANDGGQSPCRSIGKMKPLIFAAVVGLGAFTFLTGGAPDQNLSTSPSQDMARVMPSPEALNNDLSVQGLGPADQTHPAGQAYQGLDAEAPKTPSDEKEISAVQSAQINPFVAALMKGIQNQIDNEQLNGQRLQDLLAEGQISQDQMEFLYMQPAGMTTFALECIQDKECLQEAMEWYVVENEDSQDFIRTDHFDGTARSMNEAQFSQIMDLADRDYHRAAINVQSVENRYAMETFWGLADEGFISDEYTNVYFDLDKPSRYVLASVIQDRAAQGGGMTDDASKEEILDIVAQVRLNYEGPNPLTYRYHAPIMGELRRQEQISPLQQLIIAGQEPQRAGQMLDRIQSQLRNGASVIDANMFEQICDDVLKAGPASAASTHMARGQGGAIHKSRGSLG